MVTVDILVPCYNYARYLSQSVESALDQHGVDVRVLIIDDCSSDQTPFVGAALANKFPAVTFRRHAVNQGHIATFNEGMSELTSDYFLLLSADDYLLPGALYRATRLMEANKEISLVFGQSLLLHEDDTAIRMAPLPKGEVMTGRRFAQLSGACNIVSTPTAVVRTSVQQAVGFYRPDLPHTGDMEMWLRLAGRGSVGYVDADQAVYRKHGSNMSIGYDALADLMARRKALDAFFADGAVRIDPSGGLIRDCLHRFADEAFRQGRIALNRGEIDAARRFQNYGLSVTPRAWWSLGWLRLVLKRHLSWGLY